MTKFLKIVFQYHSTHVPQQYIYMYYTSTLSRIAVSNWHLGVHRGDNPTLSPLPQIYQSLVCLFVLCCGTAPPIPFTTYTAVRGGHLSTFFTFPITPIKVCSISGPRTPKLFQIVLKWYLIMLVCTYTLQRDCRPYSWGQYASIDTHKPLFKISYMYVICHRCHMT